MRDKVKNKDYFNNFIRDIDEAIQKGLKRISMGQVPLENVNRVKIGLIEFYLIKISCRYSAGDNPNDNLEDLLRAINLAYESWPGFWKIPIGKPLGSRFLNQYSIDGYVLMLRLLSWGYLLNIDDAHFRKLVEILDEDKVKDSLIEFIIHAKIKDREPIKEESWQKYLAIPKAFEKLRLAIKETEEATAINLMKEFITKDWYKGHKDCGWYNSHKLSFQLYSGYWSFETAAVVKIMQLDDSSFINCQYYPKDLVHENG
ncbi:DUF1911 domain-containing protein [Emticicia sp. CRIBPO]|uniref:PoNe immunity protein domain-containing protein n=1 Tax=Emticicia sp. CRIBPO TaxID=2683258 RepID=UPI0014121ACA|nr:PoNe immunity protein domain-containing protein [Emticicia sp. CRIBPO]NBA87266.1 DUF1911 domain-containing protein [Emticicia sp. CRIBPO]